MQQINTTRLERERDILNALESIVDIRKSINEDDRLYVYHCVNCKRRRGFLNDAQFSNIMKIYNELILTNKH